MDSRDPQPPALTQMWRRLTPSAKLLAAASVALAAFGVFWLANARSPVSQPLFGERRFTAEQQQAMREVWRKAGLENADFSDNRPLTPADQAAAYIAALAKADALPKSSPQFEESLDEVLGDQGLASFSVSRQLREMRVRHAHQKRLARILENMRGVQTASVQIDEVQVSGFPPRTEKRALASIVGDHRESLDLETIESIRDAVAGYETQLAREQVTVVDLGGSRTYPGSAHTPDAQLMQRVYSQTQKQLEKDYREKIAERLSLYPNLVIGVHAHLAPPVATESPASQAAETVRPTPALVTASIGVPQSYLAERWRQNHPGSQVSPTSKQIQETADEVRSAIEKSVAGLLPPPAPAWASTPQVVVTIEQDAPLAAASTPTVQAWLRQHWTTASLGAVCAALLLLLGGRKKREQPRPEQTAETQEAAPEMAVAAPEPIVTKPALEPAGESLEQELTAAVQQDPQAAAEVLQEWFSEAA